MIKPLLFFIVFTSFTTQAQRIDSRWYYNVNAGIVTPHDDAQLNDAKIYDVRLGKSINKDWSYEFELFADKYNFENDYSLKHQGFMLNFLAINNEPLWRPYFLMGAGIINHKSPTESGINPVFNVGIGGSWYFFGDNIRLRAEAVSRLDLNDNDLPGQRKGYNNGVFTLGLTIPIGQ